MGANLSSRSCHVCYEKRPASTSFIKTSRKCKHKKQCCSKCLRDYVQHQNKHGANYMPCPNPHCKCYLDDGTIKRCLDTDQYNEYQARSKEATDFLKKTTKKCPACTIRIEKISGCDIMRCAYCGHKFCWSCLVDFKIIDREGNHKHQPSCKHFFPWK